MLSSRSQRNPSLAILKERNLNRKRLIIPILIICLSAVLLNPFTWVFFGSTHLREKVIEQLIYTVLVDKLTHELKSDLEKARKLFDYVDTHFFNKPSEAIPYSIQDRHLKLLIRGTGYCNDLAGLLIRLAKNADIKGRVLHLRGYDDVSHHTVCDLYIDGKFRVFDPDFGYIFYSNGNIATFYDIQANRNIQSEKLDAQLFFNPSINRSYYFKLYEPAHKFKVARTNYKFRIGKEVRSHIIDFYYGILGDLFSSYLQSFYFRLDDTDKFVQARIKHLTFRFDEALLGYNEVISKSTSNDMKSECLFLKGQLFYDREDPGKCTVALEEFLKSFPKHQHSHEIYFYLGNSYEGLQQPEKAKFFYSKIKASHTTPAPTKLKRIDERLHFSTLSKPKKRERGSK
jgi:tetratricopeptide (TPR) repeat protein